MSHMTPLCVDCDGTLARVDLFHEALLRVLKQQPWLIFPMIGWLLAGRAAFKARIAAMSPLDPEVVPLREEVLAEIAAAKAAGRPVVLATAADRTHAEALARHIGHFDAVVASEGTTNNASHAKAAALVERYGEGGFDYIGDSKADLAIWSRARRALSVDSRKLRGQVRRAGLQVEVVARKPETARALAKAMRPHQWLKNGLVFLPPLAGHRFELDVLLQALLPFVAFSLCASAVYLLNDMLDVDADRRHKRKRNRPFASGALSISVGFKAVPLLLLASLAIAMWLGPLFTAVLMGYGIATTLYSFKLKQQVIVDVILLAALYTVRIAGGAAATGVVPSFWLLAFSMFIFFSLALVKRYSELRPLLTSSEGMLAGRGYQASDLPVLMAAGVASGMNAVLVIAFYVDSETTRAMYPSTAAILLVPALILYWVARLWMKTHRGEVHDDPVVFAAKDWQTLVISAFIGLLFAVAGTSWFVGL